MTTQQIKILIADDEPDVLEFMTYNLEREGYLVYTASNGLQALTIAKTVLPEIIILDRMMPQMDGLEVCLAIRKTPELKDVLVVFLTAKGEDISQIEGLEAGADDYITKPIKPKIFISRLKALTRRIITDFSKNKITVGDLTIDKESYLVHLKTEVFELPKKEFELLYLLMSKPGRLFKREEILSQVWGSETIVGDRTIDVHIRKIREKIGEDLVKTVKGMGYKFSI